MLLVGDSRYNAAIVGADCYTIVRNDAEIERVLRLAQPGESSNVIIWEAPAALNDEVLSVFAAEQQAQ